jgi:membrane protein implicated in regulation of membrane protease activity
VLDCVFVLCCAGFAVLFGALLCFALLCCAVLCFTVLGFAVLYCAVLCFAVLCCTVFGSYSRVIGLNSEQSVKCSSKQVGDKQGFSMDRYASQLGMLLDSNLESLDEVGFAAAM